MPIHMVCDCGARVIAPTKRAGHSIRCPKCDSRIAVPSEGDAPSLAPKPAWNPASNFAFPTPQLRPSPSTPASSLPRSSRLESAIADLVSSRGAQPAPSPSQRPVATITQSLDASQGSASEVRHSNPADPRTQATAPPSSPVMTAPFANSVAVRSTLAPKSAPKRPPATSPSAGTPNLPPALSLRIVADSPATRARQADRGWRGVTHALALLWAALGLIGIGLVFAESYQHYRAEELWRMERWAFLVLAVSAIQFALAIYLVQVADWMACRAAAVVIACIGAFEAGVLALTIFSKSDAWLPKFLELSPHMAGPRAIGVSLLLVLFSLLLAYTTAGVSLAWQRHETRNQLLSRTKS